ncbi:MAG: hypothetical protein JSS96_02490 [Bacteroidetes bacterium]|nr:hypothetical protein [Bacteroidota bacterium]
MSLLKNILISGVLLIAANATAQSSSAAPKGKAEAPLNLKDAKGLPQGLWMSSIPGRMGEDAYTIFGHYDHGRKYGLWYKVSPDGTPMSIENYRNNTLDGEVKYFEDGQLTCVGHYRGLNPDNLYDTVVVVDAETGLEGLRSISSERGSQRHGMWRYYDTETGRLVKEEEYQVDDLLYRKEFPLSKADSLFYAKRNEKLPHKVSQKYQPPANKQFNYTY